MHTFTSPTHPTKSHHITHTTQHLGPKAPKNLNRGSIIQTPQLILMTRQVLGVA